MTQIYRTIAQAWMDGDREVEIIQLELKLMSNAKGNQKDFQPLAVAKRRMKKMEQEN